METNKAANSQNSWKYWIISGLVWGIFMIIVMNFIYPLFSGQEITWNHVLKSIPIYLVGGLLFGATMKFYMNHRAKN